VGSDLDGQPRENKMASEWLAPPTHHSSNSLSIVFVGVVVVCGGSLIVYLLLFALSSLARKTKAGSCEMDGLNESLVLLKQSEAVAGSGERPRCTPCLVLYVFLKVTCPQLLACIYFACVFIILVLIAYNLILVLMCSLQYCTWYHTSILHVVSYNI
jgi:hypothetical protein